MAAPKLEQETSELKKTFLSHLTVLEWPSIGSVDEWSFLDLLLSPSPARQDLLLWIFNKWNCNFNMTLEDERLNGDESKIDEIHNAAMSLGICKPSEVDIIKGTADDKRHLQFWNSLLSLTVSRQNANSSLDRTPENRLNAVHKSENFIQNLAQNMVNIQPLFIPEVDIVSSKISKLLDKNHEQYQQRVCNFTEPSLRNQISKLDSGIYTSEESDLEFQDDAQNDSKAVSNKLRDVLGNVQQTCDVYKGIHNNDIKQWLKKNEAQNFGELGETCANVTKSLSSFHTLLSEMTSVKKNIQDLNRNASESSRR